ncbi:ABC transporter substrate-binding protein [Rhodobacteraceae bacterium RKSG542]|uniref:ABC transporter substrate-binding protein n=1 Tax=Pseudovibrio flavus TaxID=2529854 RepID=UPI0012BCFFCC|nr:ABC transporter substrate-binding protein [Pseudovibrio flavus]MTI18036.1 ABC transporter substrate-binding protein [Pseudovibrio flavus]
MKSLKAGLYIALGTAFALSASTAMASDAPISGNLRIVIGSNSTGGDTYQNAAIIAAHLGEKLDMNVRVDAVGAVAGFRALKQQGKTGATIMFNHDQSYLGNLYGVKGYDDIFAEYKIGPTISINPGNAYLVPKDSPYKTVDDIIEAAGKGERVRVSVERGSASNIGFSALENAVKMKYPGAEKNLALINTGSQSDKNQALFDGQADVIHGSIQGNEQFTRLPADDQKAMRFIWITAKGETIEQMPEEGLGETTRDMMLQWTDPVTSVPQSADGDLFNFDKMFYFMYNKDIDPKIVAYFDEAMTEIFEEGKIQSDFKRSFFIPSFRASPEAEKFLVNKKDDYAEILSAIQK